MALIEQAALSDGLFLYPPSFFEDGWGAAEVGVGRRNVAEAFMGPAVIVVIDELADGGLECTGQVVVLEEDPVLQGLVPSLDLALCLRMVRRARTCSMRLSSSRIARSPAM